MSSRLFAYRVAIDAEKLGTRRWRPRRLSASSIGDLFLRELARARRASNAAIGDLDDYEIAARAGISVRQTAELYEESGVGPFVRDVLDGLEREGMVTIGRKSVSRRYRGIMATDRALRSSRTMPWHRRLFAFFDPPDEPKTPDR